MLVPCAKVCTFEGREWKISLYEEFLPHFLGPDGQLAPNIVSRLERTVKTPLRQNFLIELSINTVPFLIGFLFDRKEIVIGTARLARELFLLKNSGEELPDLKTHIEKFLAIDLKQAPTILENLTHHYNLPDVSADHTLLEDQLAATMAEEKPGILEKITDFGLTLTARFAIFRVHLLKFVALLPSLDHDKWGRLVKKSFLEAIRRMLADSKKARMAKLTGETAPLPFFLTALFRLIYLLLFPMPALLVGLKIRFLIGLLAKRFITGQTPKQTIQTLRQLRNSGRDATLDQLGELVVSEKEADQYLDQVLRLIGQFEAHIPKGEKNAAGIERAHISIKVSALAPMNDFRSESVAHTYEKVAPRLRQILITAKKAHVFINIDAEHYHHRDLVLEIYKRVLQETPELKEFAATGIVIQAYLRDASLHFEEILKLAQQRNIRMPIRIVKGAYWDAETIEAEAHHFDAPQFLNKGETDLHFRQLIVKTLETGKHLQLCVASHNLADHCFAETIRKEKFPQSPVIQHECLHMTYEALSRGMAKLGWVVRNYVTVGSLLAGMAYLVRRIMENSSQVGVLAQMRSHKSPLSPPFSKGGVGGDFIRDPSIAKLSGDFFNTPPLRLYLKKERELFERAFKNFSTPPPEEAKGEVETKLAIDRAVAGYNNGLWAKVKPIVRASVLLKAGNLLLLKRLELASLIVHEGKKTFEEAIADVNEAIDFLNFYGREAVRKEGENPNLVSRGVFGVISPWNFPLAIPCGMTAGALASGNSVILKPAEVTPRITQEFTRLLHEAGVPQEVLIHLHGKGSVIGKRLVEDPRIAGIVFTGSKTVGLWIAQTAGKRMVKNELFGFEAPAKVIAEMGGKNAIIVSPTAELDEAVSGILASAFGHAGQKCSACSRVIVHQGLKEKLVARLKESCANLKVGPADDFATTINPVISMAEKERLQKAATAVALEAKAFGGIVHLDRTKENLPDSCIGPMLVELPAARGLAPESFAQKELFGPILHIIPYDTPQQAIELFNATEYALTGGLFSQSQDEIDIFSKFLEAGNIYINRSITGARIDIEPFGGFKMSGTGPKAGGRNYLDAFYVNDEKMTGDGSGSGFSVTWWYPPGNEKPWAPRAAGPAVFSPLANKPIPGQTSFNDFRLRRKKGIYLKGAGDPHPKTLQYLAAAKAIGAELTTNWRDPEISFIIADGDGAAIAAILKKIYDAPMKGKNLPVILTPLDAPVLNQTDSYLAPFLQTRSFAINTMRHGAPLELDL